MTTRAEDQWRPVSLGDESLRGLVVWEETIDDAGTGRRLRIVARVLDDIDAESFDVEVADDLDDPDPSWRTPSGEGELRTIVACFAEAIAFYAERRKFRGRPPKKD